MFPNAVLNFMFPPIPVKVKYFVAFYAIVELISGIKNSAGDTTAHFAHLGGMLFAFILLKIWEQKKRGKYY